MSPEMVAPSSAPLLSPGKGKKATGAPQEAQETPGSDLVPSLDESLISDDIADPRVPERLQEALAHDRATQPDTFNAHDALLRGFTQHLMKRLDAEMSEQHKSVMQTIYAVVDATKKWVETATQANEHAQYQLSDALLKLLEQGLQLRHDPYTVEVQAQSPEGYPVKFTIAKPHAGALLEELGQVTGWLRDSGYKMVL